MALPIRTTTEDIDAVCGYLSTKPTGATLAEAKAVVDKKRLDGRKLAALRAWGLVEDEGDRMKVSEQGRRAVRDGGAFRCEVLQEVVRRIGPYMAIVERAAFRSDETISATEVAAHWHEHFKSEVSSSDKTLNDQAVCYFQIAQGADLGVLTIGRKGMPTRFDFDGEALRSFVDTPAGDVEQEHTGEVPTEESDTADAGTQTGGSPTDRTTATKRVFITHGKNTKILDQVKELVAFGKLEPVVAMEHETSAKPVPKKVMDDMRTCGAAVIHVSAERVLTDGSGNEVRLINENVLIEIGAAMALYEGKFALLVEEGVELPSNLQGLYECRYGGDELTMPAAMKLLRALGEL